MTRRERMERRADRREEWAEKREANAAALLADHEKYRGDVAFNTQPGNIPERARLIAREDRAFGVEMPLAEKHRTAAAGIRDQLARSIFSDDEDATERLEDKAARLDARADRMAEINKAFRKLKAASLAEGVAALLAAGTITEDEAKRIAVSVRLCHWQKQPFAAYELTNTRANARRCRERVKAIAAETERTNAAEDAGGVLVQRVGENADHACITFPDFPGRDVVAALKAAGFWWSRPSWHGPAAKIPACVLEMEAEARNA